MNFHRLQALLLLSAITAAPAAAQMDHSAHMQGALGPYPMTREASGTAWQPDAAPMDGPHYMGERWMVMAHGFADVVYDDQGGPRGDEKVFVPSMLMLMAQRPAGPGVLGLRSMVSLDPLMGDAGYPLLLQTGETADGVTPLVDRQHPHDFFMELAATYSITMGPGSGFVYLGLPGEPALGPATFMHRASGLELPEAPLSHHWLDSTHITFGVATLGATVGDWKLEGSAFNGREPDENRWNIETRGFDSYAGRVSWNPAPAWSAQASYGYLASPEQLEPDVAVHRTTASVSHTHRQGAAHWSTTLAAGINRSGGEDQPAYLLESARRFAAPVTLFGRAEYLYNSHLVLSGPLDHQEFGVGKLSLGGRYDFAETGPLRYGVGALLSVYAMPSALESEYGAEPVSAMVFLRTSLR